MSPGPLLGVLEEAVERCRDMDGALNERLAEFAATVRRVNANFADAVDRLVARLEQSGVAASAPRVGDPMLPFLLPDEEGRLVALETLLSEGPVAVVFNRGHWCPYCRLSTVALARAYREVTDAGGQIVAIAPERQQFTRKLKSWAEAPFPILSDMDNGYALSLGLAIWVGSEMGRYMNVAGVNLPDYQGNKAWIIPVPATFVVGMDGLVMARHVDPDYRRHMDVKDLLAALRKARQAA